MKSNKEWYEKYNYDLMDQQFKIEIGSNPVFNIEDKIKELRTLRSYEMDKWWYNEILYCHEKVLYCERTIRYWKKYKKEKESRSISNP
nr:hypothetical protein [uncultured Flavobacterium sp.]